MPESHTLFVILSTTFRGNYLGRDRDGRVALAGATLVALREPGGRLPDPWEESVEPDVLDEVKEFKGRPGLRLRVAGHLKPCFGEKDAQIPAATSKEASMRDRRFPDKEDRLRKELGGDLDVQVWGFHHDAEFSRIWEALLDLGSALKSEARDERRRAAVAHLQAAFDEADTREQDASKQTVKRSRYEHRRRIRHDILGLVSPLYMNLDTAAVKEAAARGQTGEARERSLTRAKELRDAVSAELDGSLQQALKLLGQLAPLVPGGNGNPLWLDADKLLKSQPTLRREEFWRWQSRLDETLTELVRESDE